MGVKMNKKEIRKSILKVRGEISVENRTKYNGKIRECILTHPVYKNAQVILAYASYQSEVDTAALIERALADGKYVFAPKVSGEEMEFWQITALEDLKEGYRGIPEPSESVSFPAWLARQCIPEDVRDDMCETENSADMELTAGCGIRICHTMMWMPGAAFDQERHRIGYGKGFYDRYLSRLTDLENGICHECHTELRLTTAALAYSCQVLEQIPYESHDIRPDMLITEKGVLQ